VLLLSPLYLKLLQNSKIWYSAPSPHVEGIDLKVGEGPESKIGGNSLLHQCLSPELA
jgi:hypothetical protein